MWLEAGNRNVDQFSKSNVVLTLKTVLSYFKVGCCVDMKTISLMQFHVFCVRSINYFVFKVLMYWLRRQ